MSISKKGLGKGLGALFSGSISDSITEIINSGEQKLENSNVVFNLDISRVEPNDAQPRKMFDEDLLNELACSIKEHGVLQPILVKEIQDNQYQIIAGERRWRAAKIAGLKEIPAIIKNLQDVEIMEVALIENLQRADLNVIEEAICFKFLIDEYNMSQDALAFRIGKSRSSITNTLRLLNLPEPVIKLVKENKISASHARALLSLEDPEKIQNKADEIIAQSLSVRDVENWVKKEKSKKIQKISLKSNNRNSFYVKLQDDLSCCLNRTVKITDSSIKIKYNNKQDLIELVNKLKS